MTRRLRIGIAACEPSGDLLGRELMQALLSKSNELDFCGIAGPQMRAAGCDALIKSEQLSVMGIIEVLARLPSLLKLRKQIVRYFLENPPDLFIGIDSPDFNFDIERHLKKAGIPVVHYVSPSVWAWREHRVNKISRCVDLMLTLLPFEKVFYQRHNIAVEYVGHPLADQIPEHMDCNEARNLLSIDDSKACIALLPGSRMGEIKRMLPVFIETALYCLRKKTPITFILPAATTEISDYIRQHIPASLDICLVESNAQNAMAAANVVLVASGTATLECLLVKRPMVVAYIMHPVSFSLAHRMLTVPYVSLPNHLAGKQLVPEFLQQSATPEALGESLLELLSNPDKQREQTDSFHAIHKQLKNAASLRAADIILEQWGKYADNDVSARAN